MMLLDMPLWRHFFMQFLYAVSLYRRLCILHRKPENGKIMKQSEKDEIKKEK